MTPRASPARALFWILAVALPAAALLAGWRVFWFLTDDAFIAFRYVSNSRLGYGYVWNAPPFQPVEGYTSLLWVMVLDGAWRVLGIEPPQSANALALICALGTVAVVVAVVARLPLRPGLRRLRPLWLFLILAACVSNRTFLAWTSSGLETALFTLLVVSWVGWLIVGPRGTRRHLPVLGGLAALVYLTRPDGVLFVAATLGCGAWRLWSRRRGDAHRLAGLAFLVPLLVVPAHLIWRRFTYGAWVPNTYVAKVTGWWPESGWRYAASFLIEYALWIWIGVAVVGLGGAMRGKTVNPRWLLIGGVLLAHAGYYTLTVGGDHFEYRVYSHLIPILSISFLALLNAAGTGARAVALVFVVWLIAAQPVPWTHWARTHSLQTREQTTRLTVPVADAFPPVLRAYARGFDSLQSWLIARAACIRHQEHKVFWRAQTAALPPRSEGARVSANGFPVIRVGTVGVPSWVFPHVNVIDSYGLNDWVVARNPLDPDRGRYMAHSRECPPAYAQAFRANVFVTRDRQVLVRPRDEPLTAEEIVRTEEEWRAWVEEKRRLLRRDGWGAVETWARRDGP